MNKNSRWLLATTVLAVPVLGILAARARAVPELPSTTMPPAPPGQSVTLLVPPVAEVSWELDGQRNTYARFTVQALKYDPAGPFE